MKLRMRLILSYTILAFLASFTLAIINNYYQVQKNGDNAENQIHAASNQLINTLDVSINQMKQVSLLLLSDQETLQAIRSLSVIMKDTKGHEVELSSNKDVVKNSIYTAYNYENFFRVIVFNSFGYISTSSNTQGRISNPKTDVAGIEWLDKVKDTKGEGILIPLHLDDWGYEGREETVFSLVKEIQGNNLGYIEVQQTKQYLDKIFSAVDEMDQMIILSEDGSVFYNSPGTETKEYQHYFDRKDQVFHQKNEKNGMNELISIQESAGTGIKLILIRDWGAINNSAVGSGISSAITMGTVFLTLSLLFIITVANLVTRPLRELREQIENTKLSNMNQKIQIHSSDEDMIAFAESFQNLMNRLAESMEKENMLSMLQLQAQFDTLQAQVNPHFLYNVLNVISSRGMQNDDEMIGEVCGHLAAMLRYSTNTRERYATISQEMEYLDYYIYLLKARFETRLKVTVEIDERLKECVVPKILIQQLVENSIEHGFKNVTGIMRIEVRGYWMNHGWRIEVLDNGCGITWEKQQKLKEKISQIRSKIENHKQNLEMEIGGMGLGNLYGRMYLMYQKEIYLSVENRKIQTGVKAVIGVDNV